MKKVLEWSLFEFCIHEFEMTLDEINGIRNNHSIQYVYNSPVDDINGVLVQSHYHHAPHHNVRDENIEAASRGSE